MWTTVKDEEHARALKGVEMNKKENLSKILKQDGKTVMIPLDHGLSIGPQGLENIQDVVAKIEAGGADAVVLHKGNAVKTKTRMAILAMLNGSTALSIESKDRVKVCSVAYAKKIGATGVTLQVNLGATGEKKMLQHFGEAVEESNELGLPLMAMMYARGPNVDKKNIEANALACARTAQEIGADLIKMAYPGDCDVFGRVVESVDVPILVAGGAKTDNAHDVLEMVYESLQKGGKGVSLGRNVFMADDPTKMVKALKAIVHENATVKEALQQLK